VNHPFFLTVDEILNITKGTLLKKQDSFVYGTSIDSRTIKKGDLFFAIQGENFDGHDFIKNVKEAGAACAIVSKKIPMPEGLTLILVPDTIKALQEIAMFWRSSHPFKIVGITGSNGKTTTKFFSEAILKTQFQVFAAQKSFNNHIGVPLTLLSLQPETQVGLIEIGMNHPGEIAALTKIADPDISLVTTVGRAHLMDFGKIEGIAKEKSDIYRAAKKQNIKIFNLDNFETKKMSQEFSLGSNLTFSTQDTSADIFFELEEMTLDFLKIKGRIKDVHGEQKIFVFGQQNVTNLMAASAIALACGMSPQKIWQALPHCKTVWGRNQHVELSSGAHLIFDGYNANPDSMKMLLENLEKISVEGKKIVILGDMLEMGKQSESLHEELGKLVGNKSFDVVWFLGQFSQAFKKGIEASSFSKTLFISNGYEESLAVKVANMIHKSDILVMKGSRGARLERLVTHFSPRDFKI